MRELSYEDDEDYDDDDLEYELQWEAMQLRMRGLEEIKYISSLRMEAEDITPDILEKIYSDMDLIYDWVNSYTTSKTIRDNACSAAKRLTNTLPIPGSSSNVYRGMSFNGVSIVDKLFDVGLRPKFTCESWTDDIKTAKKLAQKNRDLISFVAGKKLKYKDLLLNIGGLAAALKMLISQLDVAVNYSGKLFVQIDDKYIERFIREAKDFISLENSWRESEFILYSRKLTSKHISEISFNRDLDQYLDAIPNVLDAFTEPYNDSIVDKWLPVKKGRII